ncbi:MAG TPA: hypothetical protein VGR93_08485 [Candidatus Acidoferrales bacterium]|nr:hypothetical protein [Candidatus Acidoferrales bacterium]
MSENASLLKLVWRWSLPSWALFPCWGAFGLYSSATYNRLDLTNLIGEFILAALAPVSLITFMVAAIYAVRLITNNEARSNIKWRAAVALLPGAAFATIWTIGIALSH